MTGDFVASRKKKKGGGKVAIALQLTHRSAHSKPDRSFKLFFSFFSFLPKYRTSKFFSSQNYFYRWHCKTERESSVTKVTGSRRSSRHIWYFVRVHVWVCGGGLRGQGQGQGGGTWMSLRRPRRGQGFLLLSASPFQERWALQSYMNCVCKGKWHKLKWQNHFECDFWVSPASQWAQHLPSLD